jgi:hypothetical protein
MPGQDRGHNGAITTVQQTKCRECDEHPVIASAEETRRGRHGRERAIVRDDRSFRLGSSD